jgi:hypothetical protein
MSDGSKAVDDLIEALSRETRDDERRVMLRAVLRSLEAQLEKARTRLMALRKAVAS